MITEDEYQTMGWTSLQGDVIIALMELGGEASAPDIVKQLPSRNRSSVYSTIKKLEALDLLLTKDKGERSPTYALVSTDPQVLLRRIFEPQKPVKDKLLKQLELASERQEPNSSYELYYIKDRSKMENQMRIVVEEAESYLLLMGTATTLKWMEEELGTRLAEGELDVLVIPTWNPDPRLDMDLIVSSYRNLVGNDFVSHPLPLFDRVIPMMQTMLGDVPAEVMERSTDTKFILAMTETQFLMGTHTGDRLVSGIFSREPLISQMLHIIFLSLFEELAGTENQALEQVSNAILKRKVSDSMRSFRKLMK